MQVSAEMQGVIDALAALPGHIGHGLVNYRKGVSALKEGSDPQDEYNCFPQQCTAIIQTLEKSPKNLDGGTPDKLMVESTKMTMMIFPVDET